MKSVYNDPLYADVQKMMHKRLTEPRVKLGLHKRWNENFKQMKHLGFSIKLPVKLILILSISNLKGCESLLLYLLTILKGKVPINFHMKKNLLVLFALLVFNVLTFAQVKTVTGVVVETDKNDPVPGVTVVEEGNTNGGVITDFDGKYSISIKKGSFLVFSFVGMTPQKVKVGDDSVINVSLVPGVVALDEVVVIGYGSQSKTSITGAVSTVGNEVLLQSPVSNISNALVGRISGLLTMQKSGAPGEDATTLRIRGIGTFTGNADPLVMIDGVEAQNYNNLDPNEIENISILKDASATAVWHVVH